MQHSSGEACQTQETLPWIWDNRPVDQNCCKLLSNNAILLRRLVDFLGLGKAVWAWSSAGRLRLTSRGLTSSTLEARLIQNKLGTKMHQPQQP